MAKKDIHKFTEFKKGLLEVTKVKELKDGSALVTFEMSNDVADLLIQDALLRGLEREIKEMEVKNV